MRNKTLIFTMSVLALLLALTEYSPAKTPQEVLGQYVSDLQKKPHDSVLREKIIKHVRTMRPQPPTPAEADRYEGRAEFAVKNAKTEADFLDAAKEYEKALRIAPWIPAYYFNQGIAFEKAAKPKEAKLSFEFYLLAAPDATDAREVRKHIAGLEYMIEKAAKESSPGAIAEKKQKDFHKWLKSLDGVKYSCVLQPPYLDWIEKIEIDIRGNEAVFGQTDIKHFNKEMAQLNAHNIGRFSEWGRVEIKGREFTVFVTGHETFWEFQFSKDDQTITIIRTSEPYLRYPKGTKLQRER